mgnify:CR=1 FL=1
MIKNYNSTDGVSVIELTVTSLDASNTDAFKDAVKPFVQGPNRIALDMALLDFMDSFSPPTATRAQILRAHEARYFAELQALDDKAIHQPVKAADLFATHSYHNPIVDLGSSRQRALEAFKGLPRRQDQRAVS